MSFWSFFRFVALTGVFGFCAAGCGDGDDDAPRRGGAPGGPAGGGAGAPGGTSGVGGSLGGTSSGGGGTSAGAGEGGDANAGDGNSGGSVSGSAGEGGMSGESGEGGAGIAGTGPGGTTGAGMGGVGMAGMGGIAGTGGMGMAGTAGTCGGGAAGSGGAPPNPCPPLACFHVSPDGDDAAAVETCGQTAFRNVQPALDFAASHSTVSTSVCVARGTSCSGGAETYPGPAGAPLSMRNGISVRGGYESTTWTSCATNDTVIAPTTGTGVLFGSDIRAPTTLADFTVARSSAATSIAVSVDGARGAVITGVRALTPTGTTDAYGIDLSNGAEARITGFRIDIDFSQGMPISPKRQIGIRAIDSQVNIENGNLRFTVSGVSQAESAQAIRLENTPNSRVTNTRIICQSGAGSSSGIFANNAPGLVLDGTTASISGDGLGTPFSASGAELTDVPGLSWLGSDVRVMGQNVDHGITLVDSPGAIVTGDVSVSGAVLVAPGIRVQGNAQGTELRGGSIQVGTPLIGGIGIALDDCQGGAPLIAGYQSISLTVSGQATQGEAIRASGDCAPRIENNALISVNTSGVMNHAQELTGIRCAGAGCVIDGNTDIRVTVGSPVLNATIKATGVFCDAGACTSVVRNSVSVAAPWERNTRYDCAGIVAPGALIQDNAGGVACGL